MAVNEKSADGNPLCQIYIRLCVEQFGPRAGEAGASSASCLSRSRPLL